MGEVGEGGTACGIHSALSSICGPYFHHGSFERQQQLATRSNAARNVDHTNQRRTDNSSTQRV